MREGATEVSVLVLVQKQEKQHLQQWITRRRPPCNYTVGPGSPGASASPATSDFSDNKLDVRSFLVQDWAQDGLEA